MKKMGIFLLILLLLTGCGVKKAPEVVAEKMETQQVEETPVAEPVKVEEPKEEKPKKEEQPFVEFTPEPGSMRELAVAKGMYIGAAVNPAYFKEPKYVERLKNEFNMMTTENSMKMEALSPAQGKYMFGSSDTVVKFARENGMLMRGHTLVWHQQLPKWLTQKDWTKETLAIELEDYIFNVVTHFKGKLHTWDVLNEIIEEDGSFRQSIWYKTMGEDFIALALNKAHEVDPDVKLFINDYNVEFLNAKADGLYNLVKKLKEAGVPLDGVGFQSHFISGQIDFDSLAKNIERFQALGLEVQFTEIDIRIESPMTDDKLTIQGEDYKKLLQVAMDHNINVFVIWGITDAHSWVPGLFANYGAALPFDKLYEKKPAYDGLIEALKEE